MYEHNFKKMKVKRDNKMIIETKIERTVYESATKQRAIEVRNASPTSLGSRKQGWWLSSEQGQLKENSSLKNRRRNTLEMPEVFSDSRNVKQNIKRSNVMKYSTNIRILGKGFTIVLTLALFATLAMGQNLVLNRYYNE